MEKFGARLRALRKRDNLTQQELAVKIGVSKSSVNMYERGEREPGFETMEAIADIFNVNMDSLYGKEKYIASAVFNLTPSAQRIGRAYEKATPPVQRTVEVALEPYMEDDDNPPNNTVQFGKIPQSELRVSAGKGIYLDEESMITVRVRMDAMPREFQRNPDRYFSVPVSGNSMEPRFHDGDILLVSQEPVNVGEIGIFTMECEGYVKELGRGILHSLNHKYEDIPLTEDVRCNGKVVGVLKPADIYEE